MALSTMPNNIVATDLTDDSKDSARSLHGERRPQSVRQDPTSVPLRFLWRWPLGAALVLGLIGCVEEPDPVGLSVLPPTDFVTIDSTVVRARNSSSAFAITGTKLSPRISVGRADDMESWALLRFTQYPAALVDAQVISAELSLRTTYHFGDSTGTLSFLVREASKDWYGDSLTLDSLKLGNYLNPTTTPEVVLGSIGDDSTITFELDTALVGSWFRSVDGNVPINYGIALEPTNSGVIRGFGSFNATVESRPSLLIRYLGITSTTVDTAVLIAGLSRYVADVMDDSWASDSTVIRVRNGIAYRAIVGFDVDWTRVPELPPDAAIHNAILEVTLDPSQSRFNSHTRDSLIAVYVDEGGYVESYIRLSSPPTTVNGRTVYTIGVTNFVQRWVIERSVSRIAISGFTENSTFDTFAFFGTAAADSSVRPRMNVIYSPPR
jgi:hypothetical protein